MRRSMRHLATTLFWGLAAMWVVGCGGSGGEPEEHLLVPPGKADDFYSTTAQEFSAVGLSTVTLDDSYQDATELVRLEQARALADAKSLIIATYLNYYVVDKSAHDSNPEFGGFHAMARAASFSPERVVHREGLTYQFEFYGEIGASLDFPELIPKVTDPPAPAGSQIMKLPIPQMTAAHLEGSWKYQSGWSPSSFNPASFQPADLETLDLVITPIEIAADAYLDYRSLLADGKLTIGIHFGYDYNEQRYDISEAKAVFDKLKSYGFASPVGTFEELAPDSPVFTRTVEADGQSIAVEVKLVHSGMVDPAAQGGVLKDALIESLEQREVILFNGHAGFSGRLLPGNWQVSSSGVIPPEEIAELALPGSYQLVMINGCDTYAKFADNFRANPAKRDADGELANIDVMTTTSFSWLSQMGDVTGLVIKALTGGYSDEISVYTWDKLLTEINDHPNDDVFFGVHGIDSDPRLHPFANPEMLCFPCQKDRDCGGVGNQCVTLRGDEKVCTPTCLDDSGCPAGTTCQKVATGYTITTRQCVPIAFTCETAPPTGAVVIINEVLADPPADAAGDANGDGTRSFTDDEFVELVNPGSAAVDLSGWTLADSYAVRFTFPAGTLVAPGEAIVVFGGGDPDTFVLPAGLQVFVTAGGLGLTNTGDSVFLSDAEGTVRSAVTFAGEGGSDRSLTRATDGDPEASLILHPVVAFSPGTKSDGSPF